MRYRYSGDKSFQATDKHTTKIKYTSQKKTKNQHLRHADPSSENTQNRD